MKRTSSWMPYKVPGYKNRIWCSCLHSTWSAEHWSAADRVVLRKAIMAAATATDPYSRITIQSGTNHGRPTVRRCHGYATGAHKSDAAIGQANASEDPSADFLLIQIAVSKPKSTASPATTCGAVTRSSVAKTGSLKRNLCTYVPSEPVGIRPWLRNGT